jgi:hypothetical protein
MLGGWSVGRLYHNKLLRQTTWSPDFSVTAHGFYRTVLPPHVTRAKALYYVCSETVGRSVITTRNLLTVHPGNPLLALFVY